MNGVEYSIPVNNLSNELAMELSELEERRADYIQKINEKKNQIESIQTLIQSGQKMTGEEISTKLSEIDLRSVELKNLNEEAHNIVLAFYNAYIINYDEHKHIIRQIPVNHTWEFIQELFYASQGKKKQSLPSETTPEPKSQESKTKSAYAKRGLKKRK